MALHDLEVHVPAQEAAIGKLSLGIDSGTSWCTAWTDFRNRFWGAGLESLEELESVVRDKFNPIRDSYIRPDLPPTTRSVITVPKNLPTIRDLHSQKILVRSDYNEAEKAVVLWSKKFQAFVVEGQPGIGKSVFLLWLLMRRLALKLPTALQVDSAYAILFHDGGVSEFTYLDDHPDYLLLWFPPNEDSRRIWVLIDSSPSFLEPAPIFRYDSPFFIVHATPSSHHLRWLLKIGHVLFFMKPWSVSEIIQACPYLGDNPHTEHQLWCLHRKFGASPRALAEYAAIPHVYEEILRERIAHIDTSKLPQIFRDPGSYEDSQYIVTVSPSRATYGVSEKNITSRYVFELLWEKHIYHRIDLMLEFHYLFLNSPAAAIAVEWLFELRMHQLLRRQQHIRVFPIRGRRVKANFVYDDYTSAKNNPTELQLADSTDLDLVEKAKLEKGHYYRPISTNFPGIDSLLLIHPPGELTPILLMFRFTRNEIELDAKLRGLGKIDELGLPSDTRRYYIVVIPEGIHPKITIRTSYFKEGQDKDTDEGEDEEMDEGDEEMNEGEDEEMGQELEVPPDDGFLVFHYPVRLDKLFVN